MTKVRVIKKIGRPAACLAIVTLAVLAVTVLAADVDGKFTLFGKARVVTGGVRPGDKAVDLTSDCIPTTSAPAPAAPAER